MSRFAILGMVTVVSIRITGYAKSKNSALVREVKNVLRNEGVVLVYLFGSQVTGFTHKESDVDIAVLLDDTVSPDQYFEKSLKLPPLFDMFPGYEKVVLILNEAPPLLKHEVVKNGKVLYSADDSAWERFIHETMQQYEDTKPLRGLLYEYVKEWVKSVQIPSQA